MWWTHTDAGQVSAKSATMSEVYHETAAGGSLPPSVKGGKPNEPATQGGAGYFFVLPYKSLG